MKAADGPLQEAPSVPDHKLLRQIGRGSYGEVWLARNATGTLRAVKIVHRDHFEDDRPYEREFTGLRNFEPISRAHEGLVDILQVGRSEAAGFFYYIMELADADGVQSGANQDSNPESYRPCTLESRIRKEGRLAAIECARVADILADALSHLHSRGLVHRDIKPSNIIFVEGVPKLADVGLVARTDSARTFVGTEGFVPPEGPGTVQADIYSLGKCLYEMAMGKDRHAFPSPPTLLDQFPDRNVLLELNEVIGSACDPDPKRRYSTAACMVSELRDVLAGSSVRRRRRLSLLRRRLRWGGAAFAILLLAFVAANWVSGRESFTVIKTLSMPFDWTPSEPIVGDFDRDGLEDLLMVRDGSLSVLSASGATVQSDRLFLNGVSVLSGDFADDVGGEHGSLLFVSGLDDAGPQVIGLNAARHVVKRFSLKLDQTDQHQTPDGHFLAKPKAWAVGAFGPDGAMALIGSLLTDRSIPPAQPRRELLCFDFKTTALLWRYPVAPFIDGAGFVDLDQDGSREVVAWGSANNNGCRLEDGTDDSHAYLFAFSHDGKRLWKREMGAAFVHCQVFHTMPRGADSSLLFTRVWRVETVLTNRVWPALGRIESITGQGESTNVFEIGWAALTALAGDLDGNGTPEILVSDARGSIHVLDSGLQILLSRNVVPLRHTRADLRLVAIEDLDGDARPEIIVSSQQVHFLTARTRIGLNPEPHLGEYTDNCIMILDSQLNVRAKYVLGKRWETSTGIHAAVLAGRNGEDKVIVVQADKIIFLRFGQPQAERRR